MTLVRTEREALCDTLLGAGPDDPTLCGGWTVLDLAAHLVVRENRPDAAAGITVPFLAPRLDRVTRARAAQGLPALVRTLRAGPPRWSPTVVPALDARVNLVELVVHHEDVRRAAGRAPRPNLDALQDAVWGSLRTISLLALRHSRVPVVVVRDDGRRRVLRPGAHPVVLTGEPVELLLRLLGRTKGVTVDLGGSPLSVSRFAAASQGY